MPSPALPTDLVDVLVALPREDVVRLLGDLLSPAETAVVTERWEIVKLLAAGVSQRDVRDALGVGVATVSRGSRQLKYGNDGFAAAFSALSQLGQVDPRTLADKNPRRSR